MTKVALFAGGELSYYDRKHDYFVGIDRGSLFLLAQKLPLDLAVGDFDSVSAAELALIRSQARELLVAAPEKDDTDTELALKAVFSRFPHCQATLYGAFGGRLDHFLSNIFLPSYPELAPFMQQICLRDASNLVRYLPAGKHQIIATPGFDYVSFLPEEAQQFSIIGAKYELTRDTYFKRKNYSSNAFIGKPIEVSLESGYLIVIESKDRS
ncbi:thiamine diphosphokinase [Streptococcus halichoeri]|uniref:thiamine diphosphokinase n=1 Tax=Streptococcus halichoeri TaxID=254785 RepID=UPI001C8D4A6E|nr:thiamine diphosphokinase [Streptococcus halichoeri]